MTRATISGEWGLLARDFDVRLVECSASGCLLESARPLAPGTTARLRLTIDRRTFVEQVQIVRCQAIAGTSSYHVGASFLPSAEHAPTSLRLVLRRADVTHASFPASPARDRVARKKSGRSQSSDPASGVASRSTSR